MKLFSKAAVLLSALVIALATIGCKNEPDTLSGTYKLSSMNEAGMTVSKSGSSITTTSAGVSVVITKTGTSYTATSNGEDLTEAMGGSDALGEQYEEMAAMFEMSLTFNNGTVTATMPGEGTQSGTYTVDGDTAVITISGEPGTAVTTDGWNTFTVNGMLTFTRQ